MRIYVLGLILSSFLHIELIAQTAENKHFYIPEFHIGYIVPNYQNYPSRTVRLGASINYYFQKNDSDDPVQQYYKKPLYGIQLGFHRLGNNAVFGNQLDVIPVLNLPTKNGSFQVGLGLAYFTKTYRENQLNDLVGSRFTWSFQSIYYRNINLNTGKLFRIGFGFLHGSNGHTQLPNYGINSAVFIMGLVPQEAYSNKEVFSPTNEFDSENTVKRQWYLKVKGGIGYHEFGGTARPINGPKKAVYTSSIQAGVQFSGQFRCYAGFGVRKYMHYADSIDQSPKLKEMKVTPYNVYFLTGIEYLLYHVGISVDGGINLYKPFFEHFAKRYETTGNWQYKSKSLFLSRVGIRLYLFNTSKKPKNNFYIAPYLNANFGQADFSEIAIGYLCRL